MSRYQATVFGAQGPPHQETIQILRRSCADLRDKFDDDDADQIARVADKLEDCCRTPHIYVDEKNADFAIVEYRCKSRLCIRCGKARGAALTEQMLPMVKEMDSPRILVLTPLSNDDPLKDQITHLVKCFARLRRSKLWIAHFAKGFYCIEVTLNPKTQQWHPHIHCIVDGRYCPQKALSIMWHKITKDSMIVHISLCRSHREAVLEVTKYTSKTQNIKNIPAHRIAEWALSVKSLRFINTFGGLKKVPDEKPDHARLEGFKALTAMCEIEAAISRGIPGAQEIFDGLLFHAARGAFDDGTDTAAVREAQRFELLQDLNELLGRGPPEPLPEAPTTPENPRLFLNGPGVGFD